MAVQAEGAGGVSLAVHRASDTQRRFAFMVLLASAVVFLAAVPFAKVQLPAVFAFIPVYQTALIVNDVITAILLLGQLALRRSRALLALVAGYAFTATMASTHLASFPGLFAPTGLLGAGPQTTAWLYMFWHGGFPLCVIAYARLKPNGHLPQRSLLSHVAEAGAWIAAALLAAGALTLLATAGQQSLPSIMQGNQYTPLMIVVVGSVWALSAAAGLFLFSRRPHSVLDLSLLVVMAAWVFDIALSAVLNQGRFDLGFYAGRIYGLGAATVVLLALLVENALLYREQFHRASEAIGAKSEQAEAFRGMLESLPQPLLVVQRGTPQYANPAFASLLGYENPAAALADPDVAKKVLRSTDEKGQPETEADANWSSATFQTFRLDGTPLWIRSDVEKVDWGGSAAQVLLPRDLTARKQAEDKAARSDMRLVEAMESLPGGFFYLDATLRVQFWNDRLMGLIPELGSIMREGMPYAEMLRGIYPFMVTHETPVGAWVESRLRTAYAPLGPVEQELTGGRWIEVINHPNVDGGVMCFQTDITTRKRVELERRESEARYRSLVENSLQGLLIVQRGKNVFCNMAYARMFRYGSPSELIGTDAINTVHPEDRHEDLLLESERMRAGAPVLFQSYRGIRKDGSVGWYEQHRSDIEWEGRRAVQWAIVDVSEQRRFQEQAELSQRRLVESEAQYRALVEDSLQGLMTVQRGKVVFCNRSVARMFGYDAPEDMLGMEAINLVHPEDRHQALLVGNAEMRAGDPKLYRYYRGVRKDGKKLWYEAHRSDVEWQGYRAIQWVLIDATQEFQLQQQLESSQRMEAVGRLAGGIAHDFNNILTVISAHAEFLLDESVPGSKPKDDAQVVLDASRRAAALTRQLLAFSRRQILHMRIVNISEEVEGMRKILSRMIGEDIKLESSLLPSIRPIRADVTQIEQILM
ncbi:MAG TPA: PAS domain S-box protein, partial [bacterium]